MTIDDLAEVVHTPRHVGRLPVGAGVYVHNDDGVVQPIISWYLVTPGPHAHGPITGEHVGSAAKRVYGTLLSGGHLADPEPPVGPVT